MTDVLSTATTDRDVRSRRGTKTPRRFLDLVVNGVALSSRLERAGYDLVSCLWLEDATAGPRSLQAAQRLLGRLEGDAPHGRVSVYGCPECWDLGCGAVTVRLHVAQASVVWSDWGYQDDDEDEISDVDRVEALRDFVFDRQAYEAVLTEAVTRLQRGG